MKWKKLGKVFEPTGEFVWMQTHAAVPIADHIEGDLFKVYFSTRDSNNASYVSYVVIDLNNPSKIIEMSAEPVISPGELGGFDDSGAMATSLLKEGNRKLLYYIGWNLGVTVPFRNSIGIAISENGGEFYKPYPGPIFDRTRDEPHFVASCDVIKEGGIFKIWYLSCVGWEQTSSGPLHKYHIKYAESKDGINWDRTGQVAIDFKDEYEYAISVPRVMHDEDIYRMWYSSRGTIDVPVYRIGYAESSDGISWQRKDAEVGISVADSGWDSEMICYPYVFDHGGQRYMLYNGNGYGESGFGLAVLESE